MERKPTQTSDFGVGRREAHDSSAFYDSKLYLDSGLAEEQPLEALEEIPVPETYNYVRRVVFLSEAYRLAYQEEWRKGQ